MIKKILKSYILNLKSSHGFTLIELIVVIGIIAILSTMLIAVIDPVTQFQKARDAQRKSDLAQMQKEIEQYYQDTGHYPSSTNNTFQIIGINNGTVAFGTTNTANWPYANQLPQDPNADRTYVYYSTGQLYWIYTSLERGAQDPQACNAGAACSSILVGSVGFPTAHKCSPTGNISVICNYGVSSPNTSP